VRCTLVTLSESSIDFINIAGLKLETQTLGPGKRTGIWVQGCIFHCEGCVSPEWIPIKRVVLIPVAHLAKFIVEIPNLRGITISGGEPMLQANSLANLLSQVRSKREVDVICFTGFEFDRLQSNPLKSFVSPLLEQVDVLIDGPYHATKDDGIGLRGSSNQRIIHLTNRLTKFDFSEYRRNVEIEISESEIFISGIPTKKILASLDSIPMLTRIGSGEIV
jgi:anaerobic ribonucleoside-triphosphate reductase activating protein